VKRAPASKNSSTLSEKKFITQLPGAVHIQAPRASMKILSIPLFPRHKFDFGDSVFVPSIQHGGIIKGILYQDDQSWQYCLSCAPSIWWAEPDLHVATHNTNRSGPQSAQFWDQIKCNYPVA
jgi:hypothetical protein